MYRRKRPRFHAPKVRIMRCLNGRMKTTYEPLVPFVHERVPEKLLSVAETSVAWNADVDDNLATACSSVAYAERKKKSVDEWIAARNDLDEAWIVSEGCIQDTCAECNKVTSSIVKCAECGPSYWACEECAIHRHRLSPLHPLKIWKVNVYA